MLFPYRIDVTTDRRPLANWLVLAITVVCFFGINLVRTTATDSGPDAEPAVPTFHPMVAQGWGWGLLGHMFLHADIVHLLGNMIFLWVFGNAVCAAMHPLLYLGTYVGLGLAAIGVHLAIDGTPAVGASGAVSGVVGMCIVWYPREYVSCVLGLGFAARTFELRAWILILLWFVLDCLGAMMGTGGVAYLAHIAGTLAGAGWAALLLKNGVISMPNYQATLLDMNWRPPPRRQAPTAARRPRRGHC